METKLFNIENKAVCISGSSRGLGKALAGCFAALGAKVMISSWDEKELIETVKEFQHKDFDMAATVADVRSREDCKNLVANTLDTLGGLDVFICNAGIDIIKPAEKYSESDWERIITTNLRGYFFCAQFAGRHMIEKKQGSIIMTSSVAGALGIPTLAPYAASKGGVNQLIRTMAVEWAEHNVRVNGIAPGFINNFMDSAHPNIDTPYQKRAMAFTPMGRRGELSEYFGPYVFLASQASSFVTGEILYVDGGYNAN